MNAGASIIVTVLVILIPPGVADEIYGKVAYGPVLAVSFTVGVVFFIGNIIYEVGKG